MRIEIVTRTRASPERCFDLSRDLDLHLRSMVDSRERAVEGRTAGLIEFGEEVTWRARHFGFVHHHRSRITAFDRPRHFRDSMVEGRFARFEHDHYFEPEGDVTVMRDIVEFDAPFGVIGRAFSALVLGRYRHRAQAYPWDRNVRSRPD